MTAPKHITYNADCAFAGCTGLINVTIPKSTECTGDKAFRDTGLDEETIQAVYNQARETEEALNPEAFCRLYLWDDEEKSVL